MKVKAFAVFDVKADSFMMPFFAATNGLALRSFADASNNRETAVGQHPEDFKLVCIGTFDDANGDLVGTELESLGFASEYVRKAGD